MNLINYLGEKNIEHKVNEDGSLTIGCFLYLRGTGITSLPDGLTVGGSLDLRGTGITSLPDGLTVGCFLYLRGTGITSKKHSKDIKKSLADKKITNADNIWGRVLSQKGNLAKVKLFGKKTISYLASSDDGQIHAHGKTARDAIAELAFKLSDKGDLSDLYNMPLTTSKTVQDWAFIYRRVTGACKVGTEMLVNSKAVKNKYTLAEIIEETKGAYGHEQFKKVVGHD